jgi:eukaryotic-like serine/threonine-protein kinase
VMEWPLCEVRDILDTDTSAQPNSPGGPQIDPGGAVGTYFVGDHLKVGVTAASIDDGYLYVDYVDGAGDLVVHLLPSQFRPDNRMSKGTKVEIGTLPNEIYELTKPIGTNLIIAISTPVPLFEGTRPASEEKDAAKAYLADLRQRMRALAADGYQNSLFGAYSVLQLHDR